MSLLSHRPGGTQYLFSHRYAKLPTASATLSPSNENTVLTSLMQALLGQNGIFLACPLDKVGVGNDYRKQHLMHKTNGFCKQKPSPVGEGAELARRMRCRCVKVTWT